MSASSITGAHFGCVLTRPTLWRGQVSLHKGANPCTSSPGACALIERAVVQRHTRSEAVQRTTHRQKSDHRPDLSGRWSIPGAITWESTQSKNKKGPVPSGIRALCLQLYQQRLQVTGGFAHMACLRPEGGWGW